jgi:hypothetical protein
MVAPCGKAWARFALDVAFEPVRNSDCHSPQHALPKINHNPRYNQRPRSRRLYPDGGPYARILGRSEVPNFSTNRPLSSRSLIRRGRRPPSLRSPKSAPSRQRRVKRGKRGGLKALPAQAERGVIARSKSRPLHPENRLGLSPRDSS